MAHEEVIADLQKRVQRNSEDIARHEVLIVRLTDAMETLSDFEARMVTKDDVERLARESAQAVQYSVRDVIECSRRRIARWIVAAAAALGVAFGFAHWIAVALVHA